MINSYLGCPEQDSNLHASRHAHLKRARLPFRHLGIAFGCAKLRYFFYQTNIDENFLMIFSRRSNRKGLTVSIEHG